MSTGKMINVGLVGFGMAGQVFHGPLVSSSPGLNLYGIVERHHARSGMVYPKAVIFKDASKMFSDKEVDLVVIATPNATHFDLAHKAIEAGKHVVVDKPFTVTTAEAEQLIDEAKKKGVVLSVFQNRRWDGGFLTLRQVIEQDLLGRLTVYEARFERYRAALKEGSWRESDAPGAGLLYDLGSHLIDQVFCLFGLPQTITAIVEKQREGVKSDDAFCLVMRYASGIRALLVAGMLVREPGPHFSLHGTLGSFVKYGLDVQEESLKSGQVPAANKPWGREPDFQWGTLNTEHNGVQTRQIISTIDGDYPAYYGNIFSAISKGEELIVKPEDSKNVIKAIELAFESAREKRTVDF
ncbi:MAG: oxidoreductase [Spirochaetales bacterium]|nr:oxidoreductase [Spirochaetales bacterium]